MKVVIRFIKQGPRFTHAEFDREVLVDGEKVGYVYRSIERTGIDEWNGYYVWSPSQRGLERREFPTLAEVREHVTKEFAES